MSNSHTYVFLFLSLVPYKHKRKHTLFPSLSKHTHTLSLFLLFKHTHSLSLYLFQTHTFSLKSFIHLWSISPTCLSLVFTRTDPKSAKRQSSHVFLGLSDLWASFKAARKMLAKLTTGLNLIISSTFYVQLLRPQIPKA